MTDGLPDRLTQLRARWEADPASRIFLQLAEEYRHVGRVSEALTVLEAGLREHPGYLSALIARGRCLLELGQSEAARDVLERVVKQDATQIVANKLLVRAYLETGQNDLARERLDLYTLLHDADPEVDDLRRRIAGNAPAPTATARAMEMTDDVFDLDRPTLPARRAVEDVFELSPPPTPLAAAPSPAPWPAPAPAFAREAADPVVAAPVAPAAAVAQAPEPGLLASPDDPFPELVSRDTRRRYLSALHSEGLFELGEVGEIAPPEPSPWELAPEPAAPVAPTAGILEPEPAADLFELAPEPGQAPPPMPPMPPMPLIAEESVWEPEETEEAEEEWPEPAEPAERAARTLEPATVTLGQLYLRQGHLGEAERLFREVLDREPANAAARAGLAETAELAARQAAPAAAPASTGVLDAGELLRSAGALDGADGANRGAGDVQARKVLVLKGYLDRIRRRSATRVS